jgi:vacuolar protein sorting-associated protein 13A/C
MKILHIFDLGSSILKVNYLFPSLSGVLFVTKGTFGQLTCEWQYTFDEFTKEPFIVHGRRLRIEAKVCM